MPERVIPLELGAPENWSVERFKKAQEIKPIKIAKHIIRDLG